MKIPLQNSFIIGLLICQFHLFGQVESLSRSVISPTGNYAVADDLSLSATVGETVIATAIQGDFILTQGFQQSTDNPVNTLEEQLLATYKIYPNPTANYLQVELETDVNVPLFFTIHDLTGKQILEKQWQVNQLLSETIVLPTLPSGIYVASFLTMERKRMLSEKIKIIQE